MHLPLHRSPRRNHLHLIRHPSKYRAIRLPLERRQLVKIDLERDLDFDESVDFVGLAGRRSVFTVAEDLDVEGVEGGAPELVVVEHDGLLVEDVVALWVGQLKRRLETSPASLTTRRNQRI